ncbi:unnamed protein product [Umbelopsis vinacea]
MLPSGKRFKPTPQSSAKMSYVDVTEQGLVTCFPVRHDHAAVLRQTLNLPVNASYRALNNYAIHQKGSVISQLLYSMSDEHGYPAKTKAPTSDSAKRYVLTGTFETNGRTLQLLAFDTELLPKIRDVFPDKDAVASKFVNAKDVLVVGIDLGEVFTLAACCGGFSDRKSKADSYLSCGITHSPRLEGTFADAEEYNKKVIDTHGLLQEFYGRKRLLRLDHDSRNAKHAEFDVATDSLLRMVGSHIGRKRKDEEDVLFAIGLGKFNTRTKLSSMHGTLAAHMVSKLESLGYTVVDVDEFYTSKKCRCCQDFVGYVNIRRLYCPRCRKLFHRDIMAAENIAVAAKAWLVDFKRPEYLESPLQTTIRKRAASASSSSAKRAHVAE